MDLIELKKRQEWNLNQKIDHSLGVIDQFISRLEGKVYVSFSGGKDSTVLLDLCRIINPNIKAVFCNTGNEYPDIVRFVRELKSTPGYNIEIITPKIKPVEVFENYGFPLISKETSRCIYDVKFSKSEKLINHRLYGEGGKTKGKLPIKWRFLVNEEFKISDFCCKKLKKEKKADYSKIFGEKLVKLARENEKIVASLIMKDLDKNVTLFTKNGLIKQVALKDFEVSRYSKPMVAIKLKDNDELINADISKDEVLFVTNNGLSLRFNTSEVPVVGTKASGVKGINLKDDYCIYACPIKREEYLNIYTNFKTIKRLKLSDISSISRAKKGNMLFKKAKTKDYKINFAYLTETKDINLYKVDTDFHELKNSDIPIMDKESTGSVILKQTISDVFISQELDIIKDEDIELPKIKKEEEKIFQEVLSDFLG